MLGKALARGLVLLTVSDIRDHAAGRHRVTDDIPYGGAGMVMKPEPLVGAIEAARARRPSAPVILMSPRGRRFGQDSAWALKARGEMISACGRYEGVDERALASVDDELSLGDFVLTGGELAALCVLDAVARLVPEFSETPPRRPPRASRRASSSIHTTRARPNSAGRRFSVVLLSGDHSRIARWRRWQALQQTRARRPDLFASLSLDGADRALLEVAPEEL